MASLLDRSKFHLPFQLETVSSIFIGFHSHTEQYIAMASRSKKSQPKKPAAKTKKGEIDGFQLSQQSNSTSDDASVIFLYGQNAHWYWEKLITRTPSVVGSQKCSRRCRVYSIRNPVHARWTLTRKVLGCQAKASKTQKQKQSQILVDAKKELDTCVSHIL